MPSCSSTAIAAVEATTRGQVAVDPDQVLHAAHLARQHDAIAWQPEAFGALRTLQRGGDQRFAHDGRGIQRPGARGVLVHQPREQLLIETAPVHPDAHRLAIPAGQLDQDGELLVALRAAADVAGVDAVLVQRLRAGGELAEQLVAVEVEVAHQRHRHPHADQVVADRGNLRGCFRRVDGDAHDLRPGAGQLGHLCSGGRGVRGVGVGHRLHDDGRAAADEDAGYVRLARTAAGDGRGESALLRYRVAFHDQPLFHQRTLLQRRVRYSRTRRATSTRVCGARSTRRPS
jgi:hypothetical protein